MINISEDVNKLWESYQVQKVIFEKKKLFQKLNNSYEKAVADISKMFGNEKTKEFISWLYDYIKTVEKISFDVGYTLGKNQG